MPAKMYSVYIVTNLYKTILYTSFTNSLEERLVEHFLDKHKKEHFTGKNDCHFLVFYEDYKHVNDAIAREKEIKGWRREKKNKLIYDFNPGWKFLNEQIVGEWPPLNPYRRKDI